MARIDRAGTGFPISKLCHGAVIFVFFLLLLNADSILVRQIWIDEFVNIFQALRIWPEWLQSHSLTDVLYVAPFRAVDDQFAAALTIYRMLSVFVLTGGFVYLCLRSRNTEAPHLLLISAVGIFSQQWLVTYGYLARPTIFAVLGLILFLTDRWQTWRSPAGFALTLFHAPEHIFALAVLVSWWPSTRIVALGFVTFLANNYTTIISIFYPPFVEYWGGSVVAGAVNFWQIDGTLFLGGIPDIAIYPSLILLIACGLALLSGSLEKMNWIGPALFIAWLLTVRLLGGPVFFRYVLPMFVWVWLVAIPMSLTRISPRHKDVAVAATLILGFSQAFVRAPSELYFEVKPEYVQSAQKLVSVAESCTATVHDGAGNPQLTVGRLLNLGLWWPPGALELDKLVQRLPGARTVVKNAYWRRLTPCAIRLDDGFRERIEYAMDPRYVEMFLEGPATGPKPDMTESKVVPVGNFGITISLFNP